MHIQAVVPNPLLCAQCWVESLTAQRRPIVFPFYWDPDVAGDTECLPVVLLGHFTWREADRKRGDETMEEKTVGVAKKQNHSQDMDVLLFVCFFPSQPWWETSRWRQRRTVEMSRKRGRGS